MKHVRELSKPRMAVLGNQDPIVLKSFVISVLEAVNDLLVRKNSTES